MAATLRIEMPVGKTVRIIDQASPAINRITDRFKKLNDTTREGRWLFGELDKAVEKVGYRMRSSRREVTAFDESLKKCIDRINELSGMRFNLRLGLDDSLIGAKLRQLQADFPLMFNVDGLERRLDTIIGLLTVEGKSGGVTVLNTPTGNTQSLDPFKLDYGDFIIDPRNPLDLLELVEDGRTSIDSGKDFYEGLEYLLSEDNIKKIDKAAGKIPGISNSNELFALSASAYSGVMGAIDIYGDISKSFQTKTTSEAQRTEARRDAVTKGTIIGIATTLGIIAAAVVGGGFAAAGAAALIKGGAIGLGVGSSISRLSGKDISDFIAGTGFMNKDKREQAVIQLSLNMSESYQQYKEVSGESEAIRELINEYQKWQELIAEGNLPAEFLEQARDRMETIKELLGQSFPDILSEYEAANRRGQEKFDGIADIVDATEKSADRRAFANYVAYDQSLKKNQSEYADKKAETEKAYASYDLYEGYYNILPTYQKLLEDENTSEQEAYEIQQEMKKIASKLGVDAEVYEHSSLNAQVTMLLDHAVAEMVDYAEGIMNLEGDLARMEQGLIDYYNQSIERIPGIEEALEKMDQVTFLEEKRKQIENEELALDDLIAEIQQELPDYEILGETYEELEQSVKKAIEDINDTFRDQIDAIYELNVKLPELNSIYKKDISHFTYVPAEVQEAEEAVTQAFEAKRGKALSTPYYDEIQAIYDDYGFFGRLFKGKKYRAEINEVNQAYGEDTVSKNKQAKGIVNEGKENIKEIAELEAIIQENIPKLVDYSMLYKNDEINKLISDLTALRKIRESLNEQDKDFAISKKTVKEIQGILPDFEYDSSDALGSLQNLDQQIWAMQSTTADVIAEVGALDNDLNVLGNKKVGVSITLDVVENRRLPMRLEEVSAAGTKKSGVDPGPNRLPPTVKLWATGGILSTPHLGIVAEDGPEAIIPLSGKSRSRGLELWQEAGRLLGVASYGVGNSLGPITDDEAEDGYGVSSPGSRQQNDVQVNVQLSPTFHISQEGGGLSVDAIKDHLDELIDDMAGEMAAKLEVVFSNMPKNA